MANTGVPVAAMAAAAWSWVEKMLHEAQRTSAPRALSVSISTAVWMVMCSEPVMRAPLRGCCAANSSRTAIRPGISVSAILISLRPQSARLMSAMAQSCVALLMVSPLEKSSWKKPRSVAGAHGLWGLTAQKRGVSVVARKQHTGYREGCGCRLSEPHACGGLATRRCNAPRKEEANDCKRGAKGQAVASNSPLKIQAL